MIAAKFKEDSKLHVNVGHKCYSKGVCHVKGVSIGGDTLFLISLIM